MDKAKELLLSIDSLCIYNLKEDKVIKSLKKLVKEIDEEDVLERYCKFYNTLTPAIGLKEYVSKLILGNENIFSKKSASGMENDLSDNVLNGVKSDLKKLEIISSFSMEDLTSSIEDKDVKTAFSSMPQFETGNAVAPLTNNWEDSVGDIIDYHKKYGYGIYAKHYAFTWRNKELCPITHTDPITLNDLKNYESQRKEVVNNTEDFISGLPANNVLLYGDRGTGKSSTIHAILNEYYTQGLRMIEIKKNDISDLTIIREIINDSPMKFIIFIDDLSFDSHEDSFAELKAALEGSLSSNQKNTLIYATSNRRHLIKENFSDRNDDVNKSDTMQESLSLSDRFGLSITFFNPDRENYLDIVEKIASDRNLDIDKEKLDAASETWALRRGGRSPRCAKQFIDYVESCIQQGREW